MKDEDYHKELPPEMNWTCGYSPEGPMECLRDATWHGFKVKGSEIEYMMAACDEHKENMRADYKHPMDTPCGVAGSCFKWPENYCYVDWDTYLGSLTAVSEIWEVQAA